MEDEKSNFKHWVALHEYGHSLTQSSLTNWLNLKYKIKRPTYSLEEEKTCDKVADKMNPKIDSAEILKKIYRNYKTNGKAIYGHNNDYLNVLNGFVDRIRQLEPDFDPDKDINK